MNVVDNAASIHIHTHIDRERERESGSRNGVMLTISTDIFKTYRISITALTACQVNDTDIRYPIVPIVGNFTPAN